MCDAYMLVFTLWVCMPTRLKKCMFFFFPSVCGKFHVFTGRKCFNKGKYKYSIMQGTFFFCLND